MPSQSSSLFEVIGICVVICLVLLLFLAFLAILIITGFSIYFTARTLFENWKARLVSPPTNHQAANPKPDSRTTTTKSDTNTSMLAMILPLAIFQRIAFKNLLALVGRTLAIGGLAGIGQFLGMHYFGTWIDAIIIWLFSIVVALLSGPRGSLPPPNAG